jgi:uncharacterized membrane protein
MAGHVHTHRHGDETDAERRLGRLLLLRVVVPLAVAIVVGVVVLWPAGGGIARTVPDGIANVPESQLLDATVRAVRLDRCPDGFATADFSICTIAEIELREGPDRGEVAELVVTPGPSEPSLGVGGRIVVIDSRGGAADAQAVAVPGAPRYVYYDAVRRTPLVWLTVAFVVAVLALGRLQGLGALAGLVFTLGALVLFLVPTILAGTPPVLAAVVAAGAMMIVALYTAHGVNLRTTVALLGTLGSLLLTALVSWAVLSASSITGIADEVAVLVRVQTSELNLAGMILGGIIIGSLGVLDDVTVTQASTVWELRATDPRQGAGVLYRRGLRVGRDHVASTVNTLVLAYAGVSLPLFVLFQVSGNSFSTIVNGEIVAVEVIRTLAGSLGLIAAVPLTTGLAAWAAARTAGPAPVPEPPGEDVADGT